MGLGVGYVDFGAHRVDTCFLKFLNGSVGSDLVTLCIVRLV